MRLLSTISLVVLIVSANAYECFSQRVAVRLVEEFRIGDDESAPLEYLFGVPTHIAVRSDGAFFVAEHNRKEVRQFDAKGTYIRTIGGPGEGPGEFRYLSDLVINSSGELYVLDHLAQRATVYSKGGSLIHSKRLLSEETSSPKQVASLNGDRMAVFTSVTYDEPESVGDDLVTVFDSTLERHLGSFYSSSKHYDLNDPFHRQLLRTNPVNIASNGDNTVYIARQIYDGKLIRAVRGDSDWQLDVLKGYAIDEPYYQLHETGFSDLVNDPTVRPDLMRLAGMFGRKYSFTVEYPVSSLGLFVRADGSVVHFLLTGKHSDTKLVAELFSPSGEYSGSGEVEGVAVSDPAKSPLNSLVFIPEALNGNDQLFAVDFSGGYPMIRVMKVIVDTD